MAYPQRRIYVNGVLRLQGSDCHLGHEEMMKAVQEAYPGADITDRPPLRKIKITPLQKLEILHRVKCKEEKASIVLEDVLGVDMPDSYMNYPHSHIDRFVKPFVRETCERYGVDDHGVTTYEQKQLQSVIQEHWDKRDELIFANPSAVVQASLQSIRDDIETLKDMSDLIVEPECNCKEYAVGHSVDCAWKLHTIKVFEAHQAKREDDLDRFMKS